MKAVGYHRNLPINAPKALEDVELPAPVPGARDLLVRVHAVSVNPVDAKVRAASAPAAGEVKVLGWDAVGVVEAVGTQATGFAVGDRVWYAGSIKRPGANSELHAVDARIVSKAPRSLSDAQAAALPLTAITAWELLFDRLRIAQRSSAEAEHARVAADHLAQQLQEKEQVIAALSAAASERLELIERLHREMAEAAQPHVS